MTTTFDAPPDARRSGPTHRPRVLLVTEGTYPMVVGGVSTWCEQLLRGLDDVDWRVLAVAGGDMNAKPAYTLPPSVTELRMLPVWSSRHHLPAQRGSRDDLAAVLARAVLAWDAAPDELLHALLWCRTHPDSVVRSFRGSASWRLFLDAAASAIALPHPDVTAGLDLDLDGAVVLYQTLGWLARVAATPTPDADVTIASAAGWAAVPAVADKLLRGRPLLLVEHGIYVRESYLAAARSSDRPSVRLVTTRISRALARAAYACADLVAPVTDAHRAWEVHLGANAERIVPIPNGVEVPDEFLPAPAGKTVVSVARIDPLKDIHTLLHVARAVIDRHPDTKFLQYGPVSPGQDRYAESCRALHRELRLGDAFRFMGHTDRPLDAVRDANVAVLTSISEGFPMAVLEALGQGRPVVATAVGGVPDALQGCGFAVPVRDVEAFASAVCTVLEDRELAESLALRGQARVLRKYRLEHMLNGYRDVIQTLLGARRPRLRVVTPQ